MPTLGWTVPIEDAPYHISLEYSPMGSPRAKLRINGILQPAQLLDNQIRFIIGAHQGWIRLQTGFMGSLLGAELLMDNVSAGFTPIDTDEIPHWVWAFIAAMIPLACCWYIGWLVGAIAAGICVLVARRHHMAESTRVAICVAVTVGAYLLSMFSAGIFFLIA